MNDNDMSNQLNEDNYQTLSNGRQQASNVIRRNIPEQMIGARVIRNSYDWKWGKQVMDLLIQFYSFM